MNISVVLGLLCGALVVGTTAASGIDNAGIFLSMHAAIIVIGGTFSAALVCFPISHFFALAKIFFRTLLGRHKAATKETINEIVRLSKVFRDGTPIMSEVAKVKNPFLRESLELLGESGMTDDDLDEVLQIRLELQNERYKRDGLTFKIIGKFPPAFGLVGTTMGMIGLLQGVGQANAFDKIGPAMSLALVATFYGLVFANFFLIPLGENLAQASEDDLVMRRIVIEGIRLIREKKHPLLVAEHLKSFLTPGERTQIEKVKAAA